MSSEALHFIDRCQQLIGHITVVNPTQALAELRRVLESLPCALPLRERLRCAAVFAQLLGRFVVNAGIDADAEVARAFAAVMATSGSADAGPAALKHLVDCCSTTCERGNSLSAGSDPHQVSVNRALRFIDSAFANPRLHLRDVAAHVRRSVYYTTRLLKEHTGRGFIEHVRGRRVRAAQALLRNSTLPVKEIATQVGFGQTSRLCHDFKQVCGVSPNTFRRLKDTALRRSPEFRRSQDAATNSKNLQSILID